MPFTTALVEANSPISLTEAYEEYDDEKIRTYGMKCVWCVELSWYFAMTCDYCKVLVTRLCRQ